MEKNGELSIRNNETEIIVIRRVIISVNVDQQCRANVFSRKGRSAVQIEFDHVYDTVGNVIEAHEHKGDFKEA